MWGDVHDLLVSFSLTIIFTSVSMGIALYFLTVLSATAYPLASKHPGPSLHTGQEALSSITAPVPSRHGSYVLDLFASMNVSVKVHTQMLLSRRLTELTNYLHLVLILVLCMK